MGLKDRLEAARRSREGVGDEPMVGVVPDPEDMPEKPQAVWGGPTRCPRCDSPGYVDHIDLVRKVTFQHCPGCFHKWEDADSC